MKIHMHAEDSIYGNHSCWYKYLYYTCYSALRGGLIPRSSFLAGKQAWEQDH